MREPFSDVLVGALVNMTGRLLDVVPRLSALGLLVGLGAAGAWAVAGLTEAALRAVRFDQAAVRWGLWRLLQAGGVRRYPAEAAGETLGVVTFVFAALLALDAVEMPGVGPLAAAILAFLPRGVGGILVGVLGVLLGRVCEFGVRLAWARGGWRAADLAATVARWGARAGAAGCALAAMGVPPIALLIAPAVPLGVICLGASLGLAQGAHAVAWRAANRWLRTLSPPGEPVSSPGPAQLEGADPAAGDLREPAGVRPEAFPPFNPARD
jgi:hypothetical protein